MPTVEESIEVDVPVSAAYEAWTRFEELPEFMESVDEVEDLGEGKLRWTVTVAGFTREFDAEIVEQRPDRKLVWKATGGAEHTGRVSFRPLSDDSTLVTVVMESDDENALAKAGNVLGLLERRVRGDLDRFKTTVERSSSNS